MMHGQKNIKTTATVCALSQNLCTTNCIFAFPKGIHTQDLFRSHSSVPWFSSDYRRHINWHLPSWFSIQFVSYKSKILHIFEFEIKSIG